MWDVSATVAKDDNIGCGEVNTKATNVSGEQEELYLLITLIQSSCASILQYSG